MVESRPLRSSTSRAPSPPGRPHAPRSFFGVVEGHLRERAPCRRCPEQRGRRSGGRGDGPVCALTRVVPRRETSGIAASPHDARGGVRGAVHHPDARERRERSDIAPTCRYRGLWRTPPRPPPDARRFTGRGRRFGMVALYSATWCERGVVFMVQPMFARFVLPLRGTPAVWTTAMLVFNRPWLSYLYAHWQHGRFGSSQAALHLACGRGALAALGVRRWTAGGELTGPGFAPAARAVGLPFFVVSSTAPLYTWLADTDHPMPRPILLTGQQHRSVIVCLLPLRGARAHPRRRAGVVAAMGCWRAVERVGARDVRSPARHDG